MERGFEKVLHEYISNYGRFVPENIPRVMDWKEVYNKKRGLMLPASKRNLARLLEKVILIIINSDPAKILTGIRQR